MSIFKPKHTLDYDGQKYAYRAASDKGGIVEPADAYRAREMVTLYYSMVATDTDYSFFLDGVRLYATYEEERGYKLEFAMPDHDAKLICVERNSMTAITRE